MLSGSATSKVTLLASKNVNHGTFTLTFTGTLGPRQNLELFATGKDHWRNPQARVDLERLQKPIDAMLKLGLIKEKLDIAPFIDLSYAPSR